MDLSLAQEVELKAAELDRLRARVAELEAMERRARTYLAMPNSLEPRRVVRSILGEA